MNQAGVGSSTTGPRVLFVSHEATRTGAPMMLLHFLRWLRANTSLDFEVLLLAGGPLVSEFSAVAPTRLVPALGGGQVSYFEAGIKRAGFPGLSDRLKVARARFPLRNLREFDVLYLNSSTSALALRVLPDVPPMVVSHIHELDSALRYWFPEHDRSVMLEATSWFVACAEAVADCLIAGYGVPSEMVSCHHEFIQPPVVTAGGAEAHRSALGIPEGSRVVGASGLRIWRKGPDLFVQMAAELVRQRPDLDVHFVWLGASRDEYVPVESDVVRLGLEGRVHFVDELSDPADLFSALDVLCVTSREDPYPLVMLEAAALGVPVVSFDNGGATEFAGPQDHARRAVIVPYMDAEAMASAVGELLEDEAERQAVGRRGQERVLHEHTVEVGSAALHAELMARVEAGRRSGATRR